MKEAKNKLEEKVNSLRNRINEIKVKMDEIKVKINLLNTACQNIQEQELKELFVKYINTLNFEFEQLKREIKKIEETVLNPNREMLEEYIKYFEDKNVSLMLKDPNSKEILKNEKIISSFKNILEEIKKLQNIENKKEHQIEM